MASRLEDQAREAAAQFRRDHDLGLAPLTDLVALIELTQGVDVAILNAGPDSHGMTLRDPARSIVAVAAARTANPMRQRSTLAHELAHMIFDDYTAPRTTGWGQRDPEEIRADSFARHVLVPIEALQRSGVLTMRRNQTVPPAVLSALVQRFQASPGMISIQLAEAGIITEEHKVELRAHTTPSLAAKFGWSDQYRAMQEESNTRRAPQRLLTRAVDGYVRGVISLAYIARLRGLPVEEVEAEFTELGIEPRTDDPQDNIPAALAPPDQSPANFDLADLDALGLDEELPPE